LDGPDGIRHQHLKDLESERNKLLLADEALWRQRCRIKWVQCGDQNNKFFHRYASNSRNNKHIWDILDDSGTLHSGQQAIKDATTCFFKDFYEAKLIPTLQEQVDVAQLFPNSVNLEDSTSLDNPCTLQELQIALKSFSLDKSPGPDGWTVEFYLHFFDLVGTELLELVEDSRITW
jgi:hypothetical protein